MDAGFQRAFSSNWELGVLVLQQGGCAQRVAQRSTCIVLSTHVTTLPMRVNYVQVHCGLRLTWLESAV
jgi:hypothetical protein